MKTTPHRVDPDPERVSEGLRDTGYEFKTAIADIIDNSIAAEATIIDVRVVMDFGGDVLVSVADDGHGMDEEGLINAMRYGSKRRPSAESLGKFGLGLKTASTAFARELSVISRISGKGNPVKATWDLDHIRDERKWELLVGSASTAEVKLLEAVAPKKAGTLVLWQKVDRLIQEYAKRDGQAAKRALKRREDELRLHVAMVYQRFLDTNDQRARNIVIRINGAEVAPWDPYCLKETVKPLAEKKQRVKLNDGTEAEFIVRAFVLPRKEDFKDQELAAEAQISNDLQGIYVYREQRLIHGPDWLGMYRKEPHLSLCRVELSFSHKLDDAFQVDIKKSRIMLDDELYDWLKEKFLPGPRREADALSRKGAAVAISGAAALLHNASNNTIHAKAENLKNAAVEAVDGKSGDVTIQNKHGTTKLKIRLVEEKSSGELHVQPTDSLMDGVLWEPAFIENNQAVRINIGHPYYHKVYVPNKKSGAVIQGLDSLIWAMCVAELGNVNEQNKRNFEEMRYEVSRILRRLVEDLPDPEVD